MSMDMKLYKVLHKNKLDFVQKKVGDLQGLFLGVDAGPISEINILNHRPKLVLIVLLERIRFINMGRREVYYIMATLLWYIYISP